MSNSKKLFLEIEAPEFGGKSTLCKLLSEKLPTYKQIRLPGYTELGEKLREFLKYEKMGSEANLGIAYAAHMDAYEKMDPNTNYIIDRALTSCFVYQGILLEKYTKNKKVFDIFIQSIHDKIVEKYKRIVFYLDIDVDEIFKRRALANRVTESTTNKEDLYDNMDRASMQQLVDAYKYSIDQQTKLFPEDDFYQINAKQKPEQILESVYDKIR